MNAEETEVYTYLKGYARVFVSVTEISKRVGQRRRYLEDRNWARPILRRMELDGFLESNPSGEYRLREGVDEHKFASAVTTPGVELGDTTIISLEDVEMPPEPCTVQKGDTNRITIDGLPSYH